MLSKATIRPNLTTWNQQKFSKLDLEEDIKLQVPGNLGIPLLPIHKMCVTEKNKIRQIMYREPPKATESQYKNIKVMLPILRNNAEGAELGQY